MIFIFKKDLLLISYSIVYNTKYYINNKMIISLRKGMNIGISNNYDEFNHVSSISDLVNLKDKETDIYSKYYYENDFSTINEIFNEYCR